MSRALLALPVLLAAALIAAGACQELPSASGACFDIPAGGCPTDHGGTCDDPDCAAIYTCNNGAWVLSQTCPTPDGGFPFADGGDGGPSGDGGPCTPVVVDAGPPGFDCMPDLEFPDCPFAQLCYENACLTGCSDFFACSAGPCDGQPPPCWIDVAYCDELDLVVTH